MSSILPRPPASIAPKEEAAAGRQCRAPAALSAAGARLGLHGPRTLAGPAGLASARSFAGASAVMEGSASPHASARRAVWPTPAFAERGLARIGPMALTLALLLASHPACALPAHEADAGSAADDAIVRAFGDDVGPHVIRNECGDVVRPFISFAAPSVAVVVQADPTGACSGGSPPSTLGVLVRQALAWRLSTSTPGTTFSERPGRGGMPVIVVRYPPSQIDCPVLSWDGARYAISRPCAASPE